MWINKTKIQSETFNREYTIAELAIGSVPTGTFGCSCPGWKSHGQCKHLKAAGLPSARAAVTDREWDEIISLVSTRVMDDADIKFLDEWSMGSLTEEHSTSPATIIAWLQTLPAEVR